MARKPKNEDIGEIKCPFTGDVAPVRRDKNGNLYYCGKAGMIKPNMPEGQDYMLENASIWGATGKPEATAIADIKTNVPVNESDPLRDKPVIESPLQRMSRILIG